MTKVIINGSKGRMGKALLSCGEESPEVEITAGIDLGDNLADIINDADAVIEFSINLDSLAKINSDSVFVPTEGMRIAIEPAWHDNDGEGWQG